MLGKPAPDFTLASTAGTPFHLSAARGRKLVLYFYPKDNTPGCTAEGIDFGRHYGAFRRAACEVFGISRDSIASHERFKAGTKLPFDLLSDPDERVCRQFGVLKDKMMYGRKVRGIERSTFVIDEKGVLVREWRGVKVPGHVQEVLRFVETR